MVVPEVVLGALASTTMSKAAAAAMRTKVWAEKAVTRLQLAADLRFGVEPAEPVHTRMAQWAA